MKNVYLANLPAALRAWRHHEELTLTEAAERIGIDRNSLWRLEKRETVNQATLITIWQWLLG